MNQEWVKISTGFFDDEKIKIIETQPDGDFIINSWIRLIIMARKTNDSGCIYIQKNIPYTPELISKYWGKELSRVKNALVTLHQFSMIEIFENNIISIVNWDKHQNDSKLEFVKKQNRDRQFRFREKQKQLAIEANIKNNLTNTNGVTCNVTVTQCNARENKKTRKQENKNIYIPFFEFFNKTTLRNFKGDKKSLSNLNARIKEGYTIDDLCKAIENGYTDSQHWPDPNAFTPEYITRSDKIQKYLNYRTVVKQLQNNNGKLSPHEAARFINENT